MSDTPQNPGGLPDASTPLGWQDPPAIPPGQAAGKKKISVSIPLFDDGTPDWSSAQDRTKEKFRAIFRNEKTQSEFGNPDKPLEIVSPEMARVFVKEFFGIEALFFAYRWKIPVSDAQAICELRPQEQEQIIPLVQKVCAKHGSEFLDKWGDEIALLLMLIMFSQARYSAVKVHSKELEMEKEVQAARGVETIHDASTPIELEQTPVIS